ncbi:hypothetical protein QYE76_066177 [Lolium multiflorum]|uniref:Uncharacterized protein n=1 Tax=Lolium multiflorum TaxID=4521 RepID=A0AAD8SC69_LOLMU|nr:hypothetical protein QYE76_066177 [Lolium multiflorum]
MADVAQGHATFRSGGTDAGVVLLRSGVRVTDSRKKRGGQGAYRRWRPAARFWWRGGGSWPSSGALGGAFLVLHGSSRRVSPLQQLRQHSDGGAHRRFWAEKKGRSVNLPSNEGRQHEASMQVIRRSLLDESRELIDHASKLRDVNAHLVNRAVKLWNEYAVLLNEHSSLSKENSSLSKENISILKENSSLKKENISILKENSSLKKEHTYYKWRSMTGNSSNLLRV